jgi:hypothetical protein
MNIKELAMQMFEFNDNEVARVDLIDLHKFADFIRTDEARACAKHYLEIMRDAVEQAVVKEREACAKLCEGYRYNYAKSIRARGEK